MISGTSCDAVLLPQDLEGRLREAEERLGRSRPEMATRQRELEVLCVWSSFSMLTGGCVD